jgi:hypothetical protein
LQSLRDIYFDSLQTLPETHRPNKTLESKKINIIN